MESLNKLREQMGFQAHELGDGVVDEYDHWYNALLDCGLEGLTKLQKDYTVALAQAAKAELPPGFVA